jgi:hypothetical protein
MGSPEMEKAVKIKILTASLMVSYNLLPGMSDLP